MTAWQLQTVALMVTATSPNLRDLRWMSPPIA